MIEIMEWVQQYGWIPTFILLFLIGMFFGRTTQQLKSVVEILKDTVNQVNDNAKSDSKFKLEIAERFLEVYQKISETKESLMLYVKDEISSHKNDCNRKVE